MEKPEKLGEFFSPTLWPPWHTSAQVVCELVSDRFDLRPEDCILFCDTHEGL